jgi:hypothetical protein
MVAQGGGSTLVQRPARRKLRLYQRRPRRPSVASAEVVYERPADGR